MTKFPQKAKIQAIKDALKKAGLSGLTIREASEQTGIMPVTMSRYLHYLSEHKQAAVLQKSLGKVFLDPKTAIRDLEAMIE